MVCSIGSSGSKQDGGGADACQMVIEMEYRVLGTQVMMSMCSLHSQPSQAISAAPIELAKRRKCNLGVEGAKVPDTSQSIAGA